MCGRYARSLPDAVLGEAFEVEAVVGSELRPSWNVAPTQPVRVVLERPPDEDPAAPPVRQLRTARWGLVPAWAKDPSVAPG